ncbi:MAG: oligosaccharide flippase family protein, partial [Bacteroidia bacterium]|nr:oligosaccharide flippase family protein [Bacteroidia bacterium]
MGVIIRQSIKQSIVAYLAIAVAVVAQLFIYPIDDFATYGLAQAIIALAMLLYPLIVLGVPQAMIKFFNEFYKKSEGYLLNFLILSIALMVFFGTLIYFFYGSFLRMLDHLEISQALFIDYGTTVVVLVVLLILLRIFITQAANFHRIVWPAIFENLWTKFALAMAVLLVVSGSLNQDSLAYTIPIYFGVALFGMFIYLTFLGVQNWQYNPTLFKKDVLKSILRYAAYTGLSSFGVMLAIRIDQIMVPNMVDYQSNGIYSFFIFMTAVIEIPARSIVQISSPILSKAHENLDYKEIQKIYSKSASILLIFGLGLFLLIFLNLDDIFAIMGKSSLLGGLVALFAILGVAKIFTLIFYVAPQIIMYSKYYRFILYVTITLGVLNTVLN